MNPALRAKILERVEITDAGCWQWTLTLHSLGYARVGQNIDGERSVHRITYIEWMGQIPEGMTIDHLCRNRGCVNPEHLEAVSQRENVLRGTAPAALNAAKDACDHGHPLEGDNLYLRPSPRNPSLVWRQCRTCNAAAQRRVRRAS